MPSPRRADIQAKLLCLGGVFATEPTSHLHFIKKGELKMKTVLQFGLLSLLVVGVLATYQLFKLSRQYQITTHSSELNAISCDTLPQWEERLTADMKAVFAAEQAGWQATREAGKSTPQGHKEVNLSDEILDAMKQKQQVFLEFADYYARIGRCLVEGQSFDDSWHRLAKKWIF